MLDIIGLIYFTLSNLYLLGTFPIHIFEFFDLREGYAISDYALLFETSTYFNISAVITGLLCGLDAITNKYYKVVNQDIYNLHALSAFSLVGVGMFPLTGELMDIYRVLHWVFAGIFIFVYPFIRLLIFRRYSESGFRKLLIVYVAINLLAISIYIFTEFQYIAYPEYVVWIGVLMVIVLTQVLISRKKKRE
jgi:hypothetical membrane protein